MTNTFEAESSADSEKVIVEEAFGGSEGKTSASNATDSEEQVIAPPEISDAVDAPVPPTIDSAGKSGGSGSNGDGGGGGSSGGGGGDGAADGHGNASGGTAPRSGTYVVWTADENGEPLLTEVDGTKLAYPKPRDPRAIEIYFGVPNGTPSKEKVALQDQIDKVLSTVRRLYIEGTSPRPDSFRRWYVRLFQLAQLGLEGSSPPTEMVSAALVVLTQELIDEEAPSVKNGHLLALGGWVLKYSTYFLFVYLILRLMPAPLAVLVKSHLSIDRVTAANFMLLWVGCFWGVWLSYGIRTVKFALGDLTRTDDDLLIPQMRLLFIGSLTMLLGLLVTFDVVDVKLGGFTARNIVSDPDVAFLIGAFCGISESALPGSIAGKASAFIGGIK